MPSKLEIYLALAWAKIKGAGKWILTALLAIVLLVVGLVAINKNSDKDKTVENRPEVAQVYEPSISTPLPADTTPSNNSASNNSSTNNNDGQVAGASTTTPSTNEDASRPTPVSEPATPTFTAPKTGVDPNESIKYENSELKFKASLPTQSQVVENNNSISFYSKDGTLLYSVTVVSSSDSLDLIMRQLKASPEVSKLSMTNFSGNSAIKFSTHSQTGYVISKSNKIYYIIGSPKYLVDISI